MAEENKRSLSPTLKRIMMTIDKRLPYTPKEPALFSKLSQILEKRFARQEAAAFNVSLT